jgi:hypothetical protein
MEKDSPFAKLEQEELKPAKGFPFTYVMFCDLCKSVWKESQPLNLETGGTGFKCKYCKSSDNTARCLEFYPNDAPRI